jgi:hypothetical protein
MERASLSVEWLEAAMIERNWTEEYVVEQMNRLGADISIKAVQRWKRGENRPNPRHFYRLCSLFGRPLPPGFPVHTMVEDQEERRAETPCLIREGRQTSLIVSSVSSVLSEEAKEDDACTRFMASDLTLRLDRVMRTWFLRNVNARYHELQVFLIRELEQKDNTMMQESSMSRRKALRRLAALPVELYSLKIAAPVLLATLPEDFLPRCAAGITACWYLRKGKDLAFVSDTVSRYIPTLQEMATNGKGTQRTDAAELLAQCLILKSECVIYTSADHMTALSYVQQAETYGELAGNPMLAITAVRFQANAYSYAERRQKAVYTAERARHMMESENKGKAQDEAPISSLVQSYVYAGLAYYQAHCGKEQDAFTSLRLAEETFEASKREAMPPMWTTHDESNLYLLGGLAYHYLDNQAAAITSFAQIDMLDDTSETNHIESFTDRVVAEVYRSDKPRDMEFCIEHWQKGIQGAIAIRSQQAFTEAITAYAAMRAAWPGESRIKKLGEQLKHW